MGVLLLSIAILVGRHLLGLAGVHAANLPYATRLGGDMLLNTCQMIGQATIPVSAVICGSRMATLGTGHIFSPSSFFIIGMRLILIPAAAIAVIWFLPLDTLVKQVLIVIAVQPCPMASVTMAEIYKSDAHFAAAAVLTTHVVCMATVPAWIHFIFKCL
jgi:predicted permease